MSTDNTQLNFALDVDDDWPPVRLECLSFERVSNGYRARSVPLFVKNLSVDDVIAPEIDANGHVTSWTHVLRSEHTTVWRLRLRETDQIDRVLSDLRKLGCSTCSLDSFGCHAIDVPVAVSIGDLDKCLGALDPVSVAVAFPSFRHPK